jgi:hypothetical protein
VSEAMYKEYDQLKNKYEAETGALHEAMKSATQVYNADIKTLLFAYNNPYLPINLITV